MRQDRGTTGPGARRSGRDTLVLVVALAGVLAATTAISGATPGRGRSGDAGLAAVRAWTVKYQDDAAAVADGFAHTDDCVPQMGYHYVNFSRLDDRLQPSRPEALMYVDGPDGRRVLAAAEWIVVDRDQDVMTDDDHPAVFGHRFDGPMAGHFPGMPVHYDLHAWAWVDNPDGGFTADNPAVNCP